MTHGESSRGVFCLRDVLLLFAGCSSSPGIRRGGGSVCPAEPSCTATLLTPVSGVLARRSHSDLSESFAFNSSAEGRRFASPPFLCQILSTGETLVAAAQH